MRREAADRGPQRSRLDRLGDHEDAALGSERAYRLRAVGGHQRRRQVPADIVPETQYDEQGEPIDNIPRGSDQIERMPKAKAKADYALAQNELYATKTPRDLEAWGKKNANRIETYPTDWQETMRGQYATQMAELRAAQKEVA